VDIEGFLGRYAPFEALTPEQRSKIARSVEIEHFAAGVTILQQSGEPSTVLYVIRKGAVELLDDEQLLDLLVEGEVFGQFSLLAHESPALTVRAHEDTLCYLIPPDVAGAVLGSKAGMSFVIGSMRRRIASAVAAAADAPDRRLVAIGELVRRSLVTAPRDTPVGDAAALMASQRVSSLLIPFPDGWAIATDRDLRIKVVAAGIGAEVPVGDIATFPARTLPAGTLAGEALLSMLANGIHHYPVTAPDGTVIGVVTDTDLMGLGRHTPFAAKSSIERAGSAAQVSEAGRELPDVVAAMVDARADPIDVGRVVALVVDAMSERLLQLAIAELGDPPCSWAWLSLGSAARHEQALRTDQDHALAYVPVEGSPDPDPYFAAMAEVVAAGLEAAGIPRCEGDAMATHPGLRRPLDGFVDVFAEWMDRADRQATELSSIGYDFRQVAGPLDAEPALVEAVRRARSRPIFVRQLAGRALDLTPPTGFFRDSSCRARASTPVTSTSSTGASRS
jgi:CBS domain-containing protein